MTAILSTLKLQRTLTDVQLENARRKATARQIARLEGFNEALDMCIGQIEDMNPQPNNDDVVVSGMQRGIK